MFPIVFALTGILGIQSIARTESVKRVTDTGRRMMGYDGTVEYAYYLPLYVGSHSTEAIGPESHFHVIAPPNQKVR